MAGGEPAMGKRDISGLTEAQSTLLMPLWARALESRRVDPLLRDRRAAEIVDSLEFDFDRFRRMRVPQADYCVRAVVLDQLVEEFLRDNPDGTVVEFGVGLDTRFDRLDNGRVTWIELDLPHVIDVREQFFESTDRRHMIRGSLTSVDWIPKVSDLGKGPWLFIAEGVLYFLTGSEVLTLLDRMVDAFPTGSFLFDAQSPWFLWFSNLRQPMSNATMKFSLGNVDDLSHANPKLSVRRWVGFGDSPYYDRSLSRVSRTKRWARHLCPWLRGMFKIVQVDW
jgi:O-methyltransferase involved in polyketide biosynthesis